MLIMQKIASFTFNHLDLLPGIYVSRKDRIGQETITTFDLRITRPNVEPVMSTAAIHTIEHLGATFLRNHPQWKDRTIYFGPMGCRTGFYVLFAGDLKSEDILDVIREMCDFIQDYSGEIPGASPRDCGNYLDMNLSMAKYYIRKYIQEVLSAPSEKNMQYPD
jgi:S-ribosylhomocysteine lyase